MTAGSWSKNVAGSTHGGEVLEYLGGFLSFGTGKLGTLLQSFVSGMRIPLLNAGLREATRPGRTGSASRTGAWLQRRSGCRATRLGRRTACLDRAIVSRERGDRRGRRNGTRSAAAVGVRWRSGSALGTTRAAAVS